MTNIEKNIDLNIDFNWIEDYNNNLYSKLFLLKEIPKNIHIFNIYINNNKIIFYHKYKIVINKILTSNEILKLIESNKIIKSLKFNFNEILKFELNIDNSNIEKFIKNNHKINLESINIYKDLYFKDSINIFKNIHCLFFIYDLNNNELNKNITYKIAINKTKKLNNTKKYKKKYTK